MKKLYMLMLSMIITTSMVDAKKVYIEPAPVVVEAAPVYRPRPIARPIYRPRPIAEPIYRAPVARTAVAYNPYAKHAKNVYKPVAVVGEPAIY